MLKTGIVSVTFRKKPIDEIIRLAKANSLDCVEVGSDVHAPHNDLENCRRIKSIAAENGVEIVSYGSYYKLGQYASPTDEFNAYIAAAKALGAPNIRIWAGVKGSSLVEPVERAALVSEARLIASLAKDAGLTMSFEYHPNTLTDDCDSAAKLIEEIDADNVRLYWQPDQKHDADFNTAALRKVLPFVSNVHVFAWNAQNGPCVRFPLADHEADWRRYLDILASDGKDRALLMEFVMDDSEERFIADAAVLNEWKKRYV